MTTPKIAKALSNLDDELIAAAAEEQAAPRLLTKKKVLALLAACLLLVGTFAMMGTTPKPVGPTEEELKQEMLYWFDSHITLYQNDPERVAYYTKWRGVEFPDPYPAEWLNEDGSVKDFVTVEMLNEAFQESLQYQFIMEDPEFLHGRNAYARIYLDEDRHPNIDSGYFGHLRRFNEDGILIYDSETDNE